MSKVYLVGAGPGDPDLITLKAIKILKRADVILYDRLVNQEIFQHASEYTKLLYCGKDPNRHSLPQSETNKTMIALAKRGYTVVRLKGGDPFVFGRGGEEAEILAQHHIPFGIAPAIVSATVHFSQIATTAASGVSHYKFKNIHKPMLLKLALPGAIGAFIGGAILTHINSNMIRPFIAIFLLMMGVYILYQFLFKRHHPTPQKKLVKRQVLFLIPQGLIAGLIDTVGGGGWGPVNTSILLSRKHLQPRYVIGTVSSSEFLVTLSASMSFIIFLGIQHINWLAVIALAVGGALATPIAACLVKVLAVDILAVGVGGLIIFTNSNALLNYFISNKAVIVTILLCLIVLWLSLLIYVVYKIKRQHATRQQNHSLQGGIRS